MSIGCKVVMFVQMLIRFVQFLVQHNARKHKRMTTTINFNSIRKQINTYTKYN
jgi:hypothetical protein